MYVLSNSLYETNIFSKQKLRGQPQVAKLTPRQRISAPSLAEEHKRIDAKIEGIRKVYLSGEKCSQARQRQHSTSVSLGPSLRLKTKVKCAKRLTRGDIRDIRHHFAHLRKFSNLTSDNSARAEQRQVSEHKINEIFPDSA